MLYVMTECFSRQIVVEKIHDAIAQAIPVDGGLTASMPHAGRLI
jgi:hypothetical protein